VAVEARDNLPSARTALRPVLRGRLVTGLDVAILTSTVHELTVRAMKALVALRSHPKTQTEAPDFLTTGRYRDELVGFDLDVVVMGVVPRRATLALPLPTAACGRRLRH